MIRVLLVEDHNSFRQSMAFMFEQEPDFEVAAQAGSLTEARGALEGVDVAVIDLGLPDGDGVELVRDLRAVNPGGKVLILTSSTKRHHFARAVEAGVAGVLNKAVSIEEIVDAVRRIHGGELLLSQLEVIEMLRLAAGQRERDRTAQQALGELTPREWEVLRLLAEGLNDNEIAGRLAIRSDTARGYMSSILNRLGVESRLQALLFAVKHGAIKIEAAE